MKVSSWVSESKTIFSNKGLKCVIIYARSSTIIYVQTQETFYVQYCVPVNVQAAFL